MMVTGILADKGFHAFDTEETVKAGLKILRIWFVVADREQAFVYRRTDKGLEQICHATAKGKQMTSVDDHTFSAQSTAPHEHSNPHHEKSNHVDTVFTSRLVEWLNFAEQEKAFDELVIVAAPATLGNIRASLPKSLEARIRAELNKDLTKLPAKEMVEHLEKII